MACSFDSAVATGSCPIFLRMRSMKIDISPRNASTCFEVFLLDDSSVLILTRWDVVEASVLVDLVL